MQLYFLGLSHDKTNSESIQGIDKDVEMIEYRSKPVQRGSEEVGALMEWMKKKR